ncbi:DNA polymerase III subunit alpha [bacterium]|nr:DNA polymerase III subunit alpha [bacterium]
MARPEFVHLHVHSHYSILDGLGKIDSLVEKAKKLKQKAVALTDHGVMYGAVEFFLKAKEAGIKPIIGSEVYLAPKSMEDKSREDTNPYHLVLLAKNEEGYKNLMHLLTLAHLKGYYYKPRIDKKTLKKYAKGLIALSACLQGEIPRLILSGAQDKLKKSLDFYQEVFGKDFYLEIQHHPNIEEQAKVNQEIVKIAKKLGIKVVATQDAHYLDIEDKEAHEALLCIQTGRFLSDKDRMSMAEDNFHLASTEEMAEAFKEYPQVLKNTLEVAEKIELEIKPSGKLLLPKFPLPKGYTAEKYLRELALRGLRWRYGSWSREKAQASESNNFEVSKEVMDRLNYELSIIEKTGYASYFLIVADFINFAKNKGIAVGPGRGSAAGSLVSYLLGITDIDPLRYGLIFERFLNPERVSPPDIDIDFADDRRDEVIQYVRHKYGEDKVAQIATFGKMESRQVVRDVARVMGLSYSDGDRIAKAIPFGSKLEEALEVSPELKKMYESEDQVQKVVDLAKRLEGVVRQTGIHAAGVVIAPEELPNFTPLQRAPKGDLSITTQYSMYDIEKLGLVKMDFLGLSNLSIIQQALRVIAKTKDTKIDISNLPLEDKKTFKLLSQGYTVGVFQLSSEGMRRYLKQLKPSQFEDLIAMVALYRPGPIEFIPQYIAGKHGAEVKYLHPKLESILQETYGIAVYQEQVLEIARQLGGFTYGEADILRRAVGKKIKELLLEQKKKLISGMLKNGVNKGVAKKIWEFIQPFARYGFNKSHAAGYAMIAYITAYLKANYPSEFMSALLTADQEDLDKIARDIAECERMGIKVLPPDVNESFVEFGVVKDTGDIRFALAAIKNIGETPAEVIVEERKKNGAYKTLEDFLKRLSPIINKKILESLIKAGALDSFAERQLLLHNLEKLLRYASSFARRNQSNQTDLFGMSEKPILKENLDLEPVEPASESQKMSWERELLGIYLSLHPLDNHKKLLKSLPYQIKDLAQMPENKQVIAVGVITEIQKIYTRSQELMLFVRIEDKTASVEALVFPKVLQEFGDVFQMDSVIGIKGRLTFKERGERTTEPKIIVEKAKRAEHIQIKTNAKKLDTPQRQALILKLSHYSRPLMESLKNIITSQKGDLPVYLVVRENGIDKEIRLRQGVNCSKKLLKEMRSLLGKENVSWR